MFVKLSQEVRNKILMLPSEEAKLLTFQIQTKYQIQIHALLWFSIQIHQVLVYTYVFEPNPGLGSGYYVTVMSVWWCGVGANCCLDIVLIVLHRYSRQNKQPLDWMQRKGVWPCCDSVFARQNKLVVSLPSYGWPY